MPTNNELKKVKSRLLDAFVDNLDSERTKAFTRHLQQLLLGLDESTRDMCVASLGKARQARTALEKDRLIESLVPGDPSQHVVVEHSLSILNFLVDALLSDKIPGNDHENWADDLETLGLLETDSRPVFDSLLGKLTDTYLPELQVQDRQRHAEAGVLPVFKSLGVTVEVRAVRKDRYRWGMPLEGDDGYSPEIMGTAMIASVHIGVDEGFPQEFCFQMDEADVDNFVASLTAAKKEMAALRQYLNLDAEGKVITRA